MNAYIEQISRKEKVSSKGKPFISVGIKVNGKWANGFGSVTNAHWQQGDTVDVELTQNGNFLNFIEVGSSDQPPYPTSRPSTNDIITKITAKINELESRISKVEKYLAQPKQAIGSPVSEEFSPEDDQDCPF